MCKSKRTITQFTFDIEEFISTIKKRIKNLNYEEFRNSEEAIDGVEIRLLKIGEAIAQIQKLDKNILEKVFDDKSYWEQIKGTRNRIIHEYWGTNMRVLYIIATTELDELLEYTLKIRELVKE